MRDRDDDSLIHFACEGGHKEIVQYLIETLKCDAGKKSVVLFSCSLHPCWCMKIAQCTLEFVSTHMHGWMFRGGETQDVI